MVSIGVSKTLRQSSSLCFPTMDITFKYKDKIITTPNLEKKLKRMKISLEDIEIVDTPKEKSKSQSVWEFEGIKEWRYYKHPNSNIRHCCLIDIGTNPSKEEIFKNLLWNESTKTGVRKFTKEYIDELEENVK